MAKTTDTTTAAVSDDLVTVARFRDYAGIPTGKDDLIAGLLKAASDIVRRKCDLDFKSAERTELASGTSNHGNSFLTLMHRPVASLTSIGIKCSDGTFADADLDCYELNNERGTLWGRFRSGYRNIKIVYVGGYEAVPEPVQMATLLIGKALLDATKTDSTLQSEKIGDYSFSKFAGTGGDVVISSAAEAMLAPFMADQF